MERARDDVECEIANGELIANDLANAERDRDAERELAAARGASLEASLRRERALLTASRGSFDR